MFNLDTSATRIQSHIMGRDIAKRPVMRASFDGRNLQEAAADVRHLSRMGLDFTSRATVEDFYKVYCAPKNKSFAMDDNLGFQPMVTSPSVPTLLQFLQYFIPGMVKVLTGKRAIDEIAGITQMGTWQMEQVVLKIGERLSLPQPYGDTTNVPFANFNVNFVNRTIVRMEQGLRIGRLEEARLSQIQVDIGSEKRDAVMQGLAIIRNYIGFFGFNDGTNNTQGLLTDPNLPAYVTLPDGASGSSTWASKTAQEIISDILLMIVSIRNNCADIVDPGKDPTTLVLPTNVVDYLSQVTILNLTLTVKDWIKVNYPNIRIVSCPQFQDAVSGDSAVYMFVDGIGGDGSSDGGEACIQPIQAEFMALGVTPWTKYIEEDYLTATAGFLAKRPMFFFRGSGV